MSKLPFDEQTRLSWAKAIASPSQVPEAYRSFFAAGPGREDRFHDIVLTPAYAGFLHPAREKLICCSDRQICLLEVQRQTLTCTAFAYPDIDSIEMGTCLLNSWITLTGTNADGLPDVATFKFSSVTDYLFRPILERARPATSLASGADWNVERAKFDSLIQENYKFRNYARRSVRPGARVVQFIWQPELRAKLVALLGQTLYHRLAAAHLVILTDGELIIIREEQHSFWEGGRPYGGIWNYIPLNKIAGAGLTKKEGGLATLSIELPCHEPITALFSGANQPGAEQLSGRLRALAAGLRETPPDKKSPVLA